MKNVSNLMQSGFTVYVLITIIVVLVALSIVVGVASYSAIYYESIGSLEQQNAALVNAINGWVSFRSSVIESNAMLMRNPDVTTDIITRQFTEQVETIIGVSAVYAGLPDGSIIAGSELELPEDFYVLGRPWYTLAIQNPGQVVFTLPYFNMITGDLVFSGVRTVSNYDGSMGVVGLDVPFAVVEFNLAHENEIANSISFIVDPNGYILLHPYPEFMHVSEGYFLNAYHIEQSRFYRTAEAIKHEGFHVNDGIVYVGAQLDTTGWFVVTRVSVSTIVWNTLPTLLGMVIMVLLIITTLIWTWNALKKVKTVTELERATNDFNQILINSAPYVIALWDKSSHNPVWVNDHAKEFFAIDDVRQITDDLLSISPKFQSDGTLTSLRAIEVVGKTYDVGYHRFEWLHHKSDGTLVPSECIFKLVTIDGKEQLISFTFDLTDIKSAMAREHSLEAKLREQELSRRTEIAEESNRVKSQFLARMSHEIRTPVTAVLGISEIQLQSSDLSSPIEESFSKIHDSAYMLLHIINDILDLSKIEAGKMSLMSGAYEVASFINDAVSPHIIQKEYKSIDFQMYVDEELPTALYGDALRIKQIVNNLLSNAFKYTESGSVELLFQRRNDDTNSLGDKISLVITIRDTGLGMTEEQVDLLYSEYSRFHENGSNSAGGTGLGMSIVLSLLKMMDASIDVDSEVGVGTSVTVSIPQRIVNFELLGKELADNLQKFEVNAQPTEKKFKFVPEYMPYGHVLVVDDIDTNLYVAKGLLELYGLNIETCSSGYAAIEKIKQGNEYDVIFLDQMMPGMDGIETLRLMRNMGYTGIVTVLTANAVIGQSEKFIEYGFDGVVSKPIIPIHLNSVLAKHIRDKQPPEVIAAARASKPQNQKSPANYLNDANLMKKLRSDFFKNQRDTAAHINQALATGDLKGAEILTHTLKSLAGLLHENALMQAAAKVEHILGSGDMPQESILADLEEELRSVIEEIGEPKAVVRSQKVLDETEAIELFDKLTPLLETYSGSCLDLLEELREIPGTEILARQIEDFNFEAALETLVKLKEVLEGGRHGDK